MAWKLGSFLCASSSNSNIWAVGWECENLTVAFNLDFFGKVGRTGKYSLKAGASLWFSE